LLACRPKRESDDVERALPLLNEKTLSAEYGAVGERPLE
jgi:hypothetical protein